MELKVLFGPKKEFHLWKETELKNYLSKVPQQFDFGDWEGLSELFDTICVNLENNVYGSQFKTFQFIARGECVGWYHKELKELISEIDRISMRFKQLPVDRQIKRDDSSEPNLRYYTFEELKEKNYNEFNNIYEINKYYLDRLLNFAVEAKSKNSGLIILSDTLQYSDLGYLTLPALTNSLEQKVSSIQSAVHLEKKVRSGANWFYWIAGMSIVNTIIVLFKGDWNFMVGLGLTQVVDALISQVEVVPNWVSLFFNVPIAGLFLILGIFANKKKFAAFIAGLVFYLLDGLIFIVAGDFVSFGFHLFASFWILLGLIALKKYRKQTAVVGIETI